MLNYNHLYYFHVVAIEGSVASAAQRLGLTQPTVSEQIRTLERTLTVTLFERQPSGLRLTEAGRLTFQHTSVMFRAGERLREALGHNSTAVPRTLRIGISGAVGRATTTDFLMPLLALDAFIPSIRVGESVYLLRDICSAELDLALVDTEPTAAARRGLEVVLLDRMHLVAVTRPDVEVAPDWQNVGLVHYRNNSALRGDVETYLETHGLRPRLVAETDDALFLIEAVARGGYVAFVPRSVARDPIVTGRLTALARVETSHAGVYAVHQDRQTADLVTNAVKLLIEHLFATSALEPAEHES